MFTGIIEEVGTIKQIKESGEAVEMTIAASTVLTDVHEGDSIAVNGVCLTVTSFTDIEFVVDLMPETVRASSLQSLNTNSKVNLERAMHAQGRFGGHFVSGHVDGLGTIVRKTPEQNAIYYTIQVSKELRRYMINKGSVTVDGTSLTIFGVDDSSFTISIIPHTVDQTIIGDKQVGDIVNIECDLVGKYIEQFIQNPRKEGVTSGFLAEHGFTT
ncbi:riboflavin synthase [Alkalicoccobacillus plakortidis]|uniref:Riboflavin synthase n=1 Tax=Alkalicoccobacillus plakortidis TaxID=444060 RepID=A0ABT0XGB4_9BACI|nr:riboflavin synthase [Alkalicoccobacillus plakortidis]MCM2674264.1 riboflavin synthase [Alkalicoccobacillus plakortidis]